MSGYEITEDDLDKIYEIIIHSGEKGISRDEFIELIRPLRRSVQALLKMMECNGFLLYEDGGNYNFRIYAFTAVVTDEIFDKLDILMRNKKDG